tara:strand:+ start:138 stop:335 length:198 start_codon:yes stop_codon:yes gene_type:complete
MIKFFDIYNQDINLFDNILKALKKLYKNQKYIDAEQIAKQGLGIPIDPNLNKKEISKIINLLNNF